MAVNTARSPGCRMDQKFTLKSNVITLEPKSTATPTKLIMGQDGTEHGDNATSPVAQAVFRRTAPYSTATQTLTSMSIVQPDYRSSANSCNANENITTK